MPVLGTLLIVCLAILEILWYVSVLLMADLAPAVCPSWAITPDEVELALGALPAFHAKWWNDPVLKEKDWMVQPDNLPFYQAAISAAHGSAETLHDLYDNALPTTAVMAHVADRIPELLSLIASRPFTFVHGDYHAKQMFFPDAERGEFAVIDWQFPFVAPGAWDFARLAGMCLDTGERRRREDALLSNYHQGLISAGVENYSREELEIDYRLGLIVSQMIMCVAHVGTDVELFRKECAALQVDWQDAMLYRTQQALEDWQVLDFVKSI